MSDLRWKLKWTVKAITPPILVLFAKTVLIKLGLREPDEQPEPAAPTPEPEGEPEWEYVPEGWARGARDPSVKGWDVEAVANAYREKWPAFARSLEGARPLGVYHELGAGEEITGEDPAAHNLILTFAYVAGLAAHGKRRLSFLDWGGGIGHYGLIARAVLPVEVDYHCREVPHIAAVGREAGAQGRYVSDDSWADRTYDLVMASGSLQYAEDWRALLADLAGVCGGGYLYVTRLPYARSSASFHILQRAYRYGYETEYVGWVVSRDELLAFAPTVGLTLEREFVIDAWLSAPGAPEDPIGHRGFLFTVALAREAMAA
jgi:putative methyltransferase (TIGR04325 family)